MGELPRLSISPPLRQLLVGRDRRSIGRVPEVLVLLHRSPRRVVRELVAALTDPDSLVRMRAADALEKASAKSPRLLAPHQRVLLTLAATATQQELRWHLAQMLPRLPLSLSRCQVIAKILRTYLRDRSAIVRVMALQGLADVAESDPRLRRSVGQLLVNARRRGTPAMQARARRLFAKAASRPAQRT